MGVWTGGSVKKIPLKPVIVALWHIQKPMQNFNLNQPYLRYEFGWYNLEMDAWVNHEMDALVNLN